MRLLLHLLLLWLTASAVLCTAEESADTSPSSSSSLGPQVLTESTAEARFQEGQWLVEFFAPWCTHCQKLQPIWEQVAHQLHANTHINVGQLDCTAAAAVCSRAGVKGYPFIKFIDGEFSYVYPGTRSKDELLAFVDQVSAPPVTVLESDDELQSLVREKSVVFQFRGSKKAHTKEYAAFAHAAKACVLVTTAAVVKPSSDAAPSIVVHKDDRVVAYEGDWNKESVEAWFRQEQFPAAFELTIPRARALREEEPNTKIVLSIFPEPSDDLATSPLVKTMKRAAIEGDKAALKGYKFAWLIASKWGAFVRASFGLANEDMPAVLVFDTHSLEHYPLSKDHSVSTLTKDTLVTLCRNVTSGAIEAKGGRGFWASLQSSLFNTMDNFMHALYSVWAEHPSLVYGAAIMFILLLIVKVRGWFADAAKARKAKKGKND